MEKRGAILVLGLILTVVMVSSASAYFDVSRGYVEDVVNGFVDFFEPILRATLGGPDWSGYFLFEKLLLLILIISFIEVSLKNVPVFEVQTGIRRIVAVVVAFLGVRFISVEWINSILLQYQVLAIGVTAIIPFAIFFFFIHGVFIDHDFMRKISWIFFIIVYFGLWSTAGIGSFSAIYFWTMIASLVFLFFDGTIHRYYLKQQMKAAGSTDKWRHIANLRRDISDIENDVRHNRIPARVGRNLIKKKQKQISWMQKHF